MGGLICKVYACVAARLPSSTTRSVTATLVFAVFAGGVQITPPVLAATVIPVGPLTKEYVNGSLSGSVAVAGYWYSSPARATVRAELMNEGPRLPRATVRTKPELH